MWCHSPVYSYIGVDNDKKIGWKFYKDIDIIIGGHSHTPLFKPEFVKV